MAVPNACEIYTDFVPLPLQEQERSLEVSSVSGGVDGREELADICVRGGQQCTERRSHGFSGPHHPRAWVLDTANDADPDAFRRGAVHRLYLGLLRGILLRKCSVRCHAVMSAAGTGRCLGNVASAAD